MTRTPDTDVMIETLSSRPVDFCKLFTCEEIEGIERKLLSLKEKLVLSRSQENIDNLERFARAFLESWNARVALHNERAQAYNTSILNGTHPALGKGIISDIFDGIRNFFR